ncbi:hypothetical protein DFH29DRAFT_1046484 [Suillus ampliporus]|nr:hypothetical protein DFH29DRAFT_1046484 [Suillus ampliporus]
MFKPVSVCPPFVPFINKVQANIARARRPISHHDEDDEDDEDDDDDAEEYRQPLAPAIIASACQFYNEISHRIRPSAALHDVQQGRITSALSGAYARGTAQHVHSAMLHSCRLGLPHQRYNDKIKLDNVPRALRMENIYILQLDSMISAKRNGHSIYMDVVVPLARAWSHPHICDTLRPHLFVFAPRVFPQIYQWMTFGVTSLLERIWEHQQPLMVQKQRPSPQMVELCAMLERALAYAHTGNAKVLASSLMRPFWLIRSLLEQGLPTLAPTVHCEVSGVLPVSVSPADWPTVTCLNLPAIASKRSQILTYGAEHFQAYQAEFHIQLSINNPSSMSFMQYLPDMRHAIIIAVIAFQTFVADVKTLVSLAVTKRCNELDGNDTHASTMEATTRRLNLKKWLACPQPLSYDEKAYKCLLRCIVGDPDDYSLGLPNPTKVKLSIRDFAKLIADMSHEKSPTPLAAPLISSGSSPTIFKVALQYMSKYVPRHSPAAAKTFLQNALIVAANHLHINNIPWHLPAARGRRPQKPHFESWVNLGKAAIVPSLTRLNSQVLDPAEEASQRAQASDTRAAWAAGSITLQSLPDFISRSVPPNEFTIDNIAVDKTEPKDSVTRKTYQWAFAEFDMAVPLHRLALLVGIYVSKITPNLFYDRQQRPDHHAFDTMFDFTKALRRMAWEPKSTRKGCKVAAPFVPMVTAFIMAVYDITSPLQAYFHDHQTFPKPWNKKNSNKGIGSLLLIRIGLAKARSGRIWTGGALKIDWTLLTRDELATFQNTIFAMLDDREFGPFRIAQAMFGTLTAQELGRSTHTFTINPGVASTSLGKRSTSSSGVQSVVGYDGDTEVEVEQMSTPAPKRRRVAA